MPNRKSGPFSCLRHAPRPASPTPCFKCVDTFPKAERGPRTVTRKPLHAPTPTRVPCMYTHPVAPAVARTSPCCLGFEPAGWKTRVRLFPRSRNKPTAAPPGPCTAEAGLTPRNSNLHFDRCATFAHSTTHSLQTPHLEPGLAAHTSARLVTHSQTRPVSDCKDSRSFATAAKPPQHRAAYK